MAKWTSEYRATQRVEISIPVDGVPRWIAGEVIERRERALRVVVKAPAGESEYVITRGADVRPILTRPDASARYRTSEMQPDATCSLDEMLDANAEHPDVCDAVRRLRVGETYVDMITVERVS